MNARLEETTSQADPVVRGIVVVTVAITIVGMLALVRAAVGDRVPHVPRCGSRTRPPSRSRWTPSTPPAPASASASPRPAPCPPSTRSPTSAPPGPWSPTYGGEEVHQETMARSALAARDWTFTIPADATAALERAGFQ
jgi:hypothetical protein